MSVLETSATSIVSHWINGKEEPATSGRHGVVNNPGTGEVIAKVGFAGVEDVDRAVAAAKAAASEWRGTPLSRRAEVFFHLRDLIVSNRAELARIISRENGKTNADALGEVARGLENVEFACGVPNMLKGGYSEQASRGGDVYQIRPPLGVVAGDYALQFSGDGAAVDAFECDRLRQRIHTQALGEGPLGEHLACRTRQGSW